MYKLKKLNIQSLQISAIHINSILIWVQKDIWVQDILLLEVWVNGGGGGCHTCSSDEGKRSLIFAHAVAGDSGYGLLFRKIGVYI